MKQLWFGWPKDWRMGEDLFPISRQIPPPPIKREHWPLEFWLTIGLILLFWFGAWLMEPTIFSPIP